MSIRRRITALEKLQAQRIEHIATLNDRLDELVERKQREIDNLQAQITIDSVS